MSLTKALNSKANIKQYSAADLPVNPRQPVIGRYAAVSTAQQTVINHGLQIDTLTNPDVFLLMVDGKVLTPGSANDFTFTNVDSSGFSSQVTLTQPIPASLNIQAIKLGLKKETEFAQDARFTGLYEEMDQGFQGFTKAPLMVATSTPGTPAAGTFYSSIVNRAPMTDFANDLGARMGIERIHTNVIYRMLGEAGPNQEPVYGVQGDIQGRIRFVGNFQNALNSAGQHVDWSNLSDFVEITFYGTGLNIMYGVDGSNRAFSYQVDGGSTVVGSYPASGSSVINGRLYNPNQVLPVVAGLAPGVHTIRITDSGAVAAYMYGFEIVNESSSVSVTAGTGYVQGQRNISSSLQSILFSAPVTGTRGGRVVVYQKADGTIGQAWQAVNAAQANMSLADHSNEEVARSYFFREFGVADQGTGDFSNLTGTSSRGFTLEDGTTSLLGLNVDNGSVEAVGGSATGIYYTFTFVGTGLDIICPVTTGGLSAAQTITVDGVDILVSSQVSVPNIGAAQIKIVSGLPYGTHTVKILKTVANGVWDFRVRTFIVYQPKKPAIPSGCVELADYNVMANYSTAGISVNGNVAEGIQVVQGTLKKVAALREAVYTGTWTLAGPNSVTTTGSSGWNMTSTTNGSTVRTTFFGTGVVLHLKRNSGTNAAFTTTIDGSLNATGTVLTTSSATNLGGGSYNTVGSGAQDSGPSRIAFTGLALGIHTIILTKTDANFFCIEGFDVITPIHSYANEIVDSQNSLPIGSMSLSDTRKSSPVKDVASKKAWALATGLNSTPTTTSTTAVPMPDMSVTIRVGADGKPATVKISYSAEVYGSTTNNISVSMFVDGIQVGNARGSTFPGANQPQTLSDIIRVPLSPGVHKIDLYWVTNTGTANANSTRRTLLVEEI